MRSPLVDLRVRSGHRLDHGGRRARRVGDADEVVEDPLAPEVVEDLLTRAAAREARRDDRLAKQLERPGDVDALPAGDRERVARAVAVAELEVRDRQRAVDGRV